MNGEAKRWRGWAMAMQPGGDRWTSFVHVCGQAVAAYRAAGMPQEVELAEIIDLLISHERGCPS